MPEKASTRQLRELHRYSWEIVRNGRVIETFHMDLLPETYAVDHPAKATITQTRGTGFVDFFGLGHGQITMSGTTGYTERPNPNKSAITDDTTDGFERWQSFRDFFERFFLYVTADPGITYYMHFLNWTENDYFIVWPTSKPQLQRNIQQPLLYRYSLAVTLIAKLAEQPYRQRAGDRTIEELATQGEKRVGVIADAIEENQEGLWTLFVTDIQNSGSIPELEDEDKDANVQAYLDKILDRNKPADYARPTDSADPLMTRTRALKTKIDEFTNRAQPFINTTHEEVRAVSAYWRDVLDACEYAVNVPANFARQVKETLCSVQSLLLYPQLFRSSAQQILTDLTSVLRDSGCATTLRF